MSRMPDDIRASIAARLGLTKAPPTPEQVKAAARAQSIHERGAMTAGIVAGITAASPALGAKMREILATPIPAPPNWTPTREGAEQEMRQTAAGVRILAYRREVEALGARLAADPKDTEAGALLVERTTAIRELEQRFPRAAALARRELQRERAESER